MKTECLFTVKNITNIKLSNSFSSWCNNEKRFSNFK